MYAPESRLQASHPLFSLYSRGIISILPVASLEHLIGQNDFRLFAKKDWSFAIISGVLQIRLNYSNLCIFDM